MAEDPHSRRSVVVTGMGVLSPIGNGLQAFCESLVQGRSGVGEASAYNTDGYCFRHACEVKDFEPERHFERRELRRMDRASQFVLVAGEEALTDAKLAGGNLTEIRAAVVLGTTHGGMVSGLRYYDEYRGGRAHLGLLADFMPYSASDRLAGRYGIPGPNLTISTACSTGSVSLICGVDLIRSGTADVVVAGGFDTITKLTDAGFGVLRCVTDDAIRPFDKNRSGFLLGEGCGIVVLEERKHALARSARIYARVAGVGATSDAYHMTAPHKDGDGLARAMKQALADAEIAPASISYINAHGTATRHNDASETLAIKQALGNYAYSIPVSSTKSMTGHTLGAAGTLEAIACILALQQGFIPPTINYETPDPDCDLYYVPNRSCPANLQVVLSNSAGFGGNNASVLFRK